MYEVSIELLKEDSTSRGHMTYYSANLPDLCAVATILTPPFEITVYDNNWDQQDIKEQHDEPGDKGNYGGFWHTLEYYPGYEKEWKAMYDTHNA